LRCVFDTNVLVSAFLVPDSQPRRALELVRRKGAVLLSAAALVELREVLDRPRVLRYTRNQLVEPFLAVLRREAEWVDVTATIAVCRDPKDDKFLELAVDGRATHIITGDLDLLTLNPFREIRILPAHAFLDAET
jgi:putative PIN family toxin of toxin-antitoxin system